METYRHALYRYSTGDGFTASTGGPLVDVPERAGQVASFKGEPLMHTLINVEGKVELLREADRVSMQQEDLMRQIKNLGYNPEMGRQLTVLKKRVDLIRHLMTNYPIIFVTRPDLEKMYHLYVKNVPGLDFWIARAIKYNKPPGGFERYVKTATRVNKGYNLFDQFGRKLNKKDRELLDSIKPPGALLGFGDTTLTLTAIAGICILAFIVYRVVFK